jgi:acyl-CoA synthetase (AMP-forming)/AMP-acid ligase II/3-oxoacyl-(acyl-carrier-protein) synthase
MHKKLGICSGDAVGILSTNSVEVLILHYACALLRTTLLNLNTHLVSHELNHILDDSAAVTVFARESIHGKTLRDALTTQETIKCATKSVVWLPEENLTGAGIAGNSHDLIHLTTKLVSSGSIDHLTNIIQFEWHDEVWYQHWNRSTLKSKNMQVSDAIYFSDLSTTIAAVANNPAHVYYTSGTTGAPKGVALSQTIVHKHTVAITVEMGINSADIWLHAAPIFHLVDAFAVYAISWVSARHVIVSHFRTEEILLLIERESITATNLASTMVTLLYHNPLVGSFDLSSLRVISCGGSPLGGTTAIARAVSIFGCEFFVSYGMTECCGKISMSKLSSEPRVTELDLGERLASVSTSGRPFILVDIKVIDSIGNPVAHDAKTVGEVWVRGPTVFGGYLQNREGEANAFDEDGWFCTGDLASVKSDGYICLVGRLKDVILCGGENVYTSEVEAALHTHPGIEQAAVFGVPHAIMGELVQAAVTLRKDSNKRGEHGDANQGPGSCQGTGTGLHLHCDDPIEDITLHCRRRLSGYKVPTEVYVVTDLPTNANGKILKRELRDSATNGTLSAGLTSGRSSTSTVLVSASLHGGGENVRTGFSPGIPVDCSLLSKNSLAKTTVFRRDIKSRVIILENPHDVCLNNTEQVAHNVHKLKPSSKSQVDGTSSLDPKHECTWLLYRTVPCASIIHALINRVSSEDTYTCIITVDTNDESQAARACSLVYSTSKSDAFNTFFSLSEVPSLSSSNCLRVEKEKKGTPNMTHWSDIGDPVNTLVVSTLCSYRLTALPMQSRTINILDVVLEAEKRITPVEKANNTPINTDVAMNESMEILLAQSTRSYDACKSFGHGAHFSSSASFDTKSIVDKALRDVLDLLPNDPTPDLDLPLMSCGLTSLGAIRLRDKLNTTLQQVLAVNENQETIPATLAFDFPSTRAICNFIETNIKTPSSNTTVSSPLYSYHASGEIPRTVSVIGAESTSLGSSSNRSMITSASTSTDLKGCSKDHVCIIPSSRWDLDHIATFDNRSLTPRFGTFVFDVEKYDVEATGMSASEAALADPQQRLVLGACAMLWLFPYFKTKNNYHHTHRNHEHLAGREKSSNPCRVSSCAVLVGVSQVEYPRLAEAYRATSTYGSYDATGAHLSVIAGRVAFTLALSGPATAFDTACSSSLVAVVYARTWLTHDNDVELHEVRESLVGGVNLMFDAAWSHKCNAARMLSPDGRCKTFDSSADGYVRAEACGMVRMINEEELDKSWSSCHVVLAGAAANQDGRSSSLTAPNGPAQNEVIRDTLRISTCSSVEPVSVLQLHGTGTLLGDPIEIGAAISAFSSSESLTSSLVTGATKTTMGHSEPASGMVSIFAASTSLQCSYATSVAHLRAVNRNVAAVVVRGNLVVTVPRQVQSHTSCGIAITKSASVSAFAFQGTNAHAIISGTNHRNQGGMHSGRTEKFLS